MPLYFFYTMVQKVKMTKNSNQGGGVLPRSGELSFSNSAPLMWNTLPRAMQQVSSRTSFKKLYLEITNLKVTIFKHS